jgi:hypothetical protein
MNSDTREGGKCKKTYIAIKYKRVFSTSKMDLFEWDFLPLGPCSSLLPPLPISREDMTLRITISVVI